ncbi:unnamed protein product [Phytophthora fragariaefolia]|uniref:Unnamed protein product n=1 Tax=Phytophthora fragariaefolia TaxID=1490495 RepID=A0A9W6Y5Z2_9STRA|nr:unnamed protein product [Phytophthora fragariaefolia]
MLVVGVYVDDWLATGTQQQAVDAFFAELTALSIKDLGPASKFLGMRVSYSEEEASIWTRKNCGGCEAVPITGRHLDVDRALHAADIAFTVHKASRRTHDPTVADWKLAKRILGYLSGMKKKRFQMRGDRGTDELLEVVSDSDADFAPDKEDRKYVMGGMVTMDGMPLSWTCKKRGVVSLSTMEAEYTAASIMTTELLFVQATVKGFEKPWTILVDSGASGNYAWRSTIEGSQLYAEALKVRDRDIVTVRLATGTRVTVPKVPVDLGVKFLDFDSVERWLVLDLDARYDLILGMAWLERHEPWIGCSSKTLGATHFSPSRALANHEPTSARKQKRCWREH